MAQTTDGGVGLCKVAQDCPTSALTTVPVECQCTLYKTAVSSSLTPLVPNKVNWQRYFKIKFIFNLPTCFTDLFAL